MDVTSSQTSNTRHPVRGLPLNARIDQLQAQLEAYWEQNPELSRMVLLKRQQEAEKVLSASRIAAEAQTQVSFRHSLYS